MDTSNLKLNSLFEDVNNLNNNIQYRYEHNSIVPK